MTDSARPDRRVERSRSSLLRAFNALLLERGYDAISVRDIVAAADVGRSTFYEQFENKEDVLRASLLPLFAVLADGCVQGDTARIEALALHCAEHGRLTAELLGGSARTTSAQLLAEMIEDRLHIARRNGDSVPLVPLRLIAAQLAEAQIALLVSWIGGKATCTASALAQALVASSRASAGVLLGAMNVGARTLVVSGAPKP
jgi:AcrR family transcriptional regulator